MFLGFEEANFSLEKLYAATDTIPPSTCVAGLRYISFQKRLLRSWSVGGLVGWFCNFYLFQFRKGAAGKMKMTDRSEYSNFLDI